MPDPRKDSRKDSPKGEHHANRAREMLRQGRLADAERELRAAVASDPSRGDWMLNLGWTLEAIGRQDEALQLYRQAASLLPTARDPHLAEGMLLANKMSRNDEAAVAFEAVLRIDPKCETAVSMLIRTLAQAGRHDEAETAYYLALHSIDRPATSHLEIARSLLARNDLKRAEHCYRRAIAEGPTLAGARVELARVMLLDGRGHETAGLLAEEFRRGGVPSQLTLEGVRIHLAVGRNAEAGALLEQLARTEPSNPRLHLLLARTMRRRGDLVRAARHAEVASRLAADMPGLGIETALIALARGERGETSSPRERIRTGLANEFDTRKLDGSGAPADRVDLLELVGALLAVGDIARADKAFTARFGRAIRQTHGSDAEVLRLGARLSFEHGDFREGRARARRLYRLDPKSIAALHNLALASIEQRHFAAARAWIDRARAVAPGDAGIRKLRTLLWWRRAIGLLTKKR